MGNFNRDSRDRGSRFGSSRGGRGFSGGSASSRPQMHRATCGKCGEECEVPFRPTGERPVFCSLCFEEERNSGSSSTSSRTPSFGGGRRERSFDRPSFVGDREMFEAVCDKCGEKCEVPFQPTAGKPVFCNNCFDKGGSRGAGAGCNNDAVLKKLDMLESKLDILLKTLNPKSPEKKAEVKIETVEEKKPAVKIKKEKPVATKTKTAVKKTSKK